MDHEPFASLVGRNRLGITAPWRRPHTVRRCRANCPTTTSRENRLSYVRLARVRQPAASAGIRDDGADRGGQTPADRRTARPGRSHRCPRTGARHRQAWRPGAGASTMPRRSPCRTVRSGSATGRCRRLATATCGRSAIPGSARDPPRRSGPRARGIAASSGPSPASHSIASGSAVMARSPCRCLSSGACGTAPAARVRRRACRGSARRDWRRVGQRAERVAQENAIGRRTGGDQVALHVRRDGDIVVGSAIVFQVVVAAEPADHRARHGTRHERRGAAHPGVHHVCPPIFSDAPDPAGRAGEAGQLAEAHRRDLHAGGGEAAQCVGVRPAHDVLVNAALGQRRDRIRRKGLGTAGRGAGNDVQDAQIGWFPVQGSVGVAGLAEDGLLPSQTMPP